jgi:hypothetical protein
MAPAVRDNLRQREEWIARINGLADQVESWCRNQNWAVVRSTKQVEEPDLGTYEVPVLRATAPDGELLLEPVALFVRGARGRVDFEAFPSLSRVKLLLDNGSWQIMTDSNVPLRQPWTEDTFVQLARDLLSA